LEPPSAAGGFHYSESFKKFPKVSARLPKRSENRRFLSDSRRKLQEKDYYYHRLMPKLTGLKARRKFPAPGGRGSRPSITISKWASSARNTAGREQSVLLVGSEVEASGQGHSPERATRTNNERQLQACQEKFDRAFSAPFWPARRGGNEAAGFVLSGRALTDRDLL
jgi:hypothetical protein